MFSGAKAHECVVRALYVKPVVECCRYFLRTAISFQQYSMRITEYILGVANVLKVGYENFYVVFTLFDTGTDTETNKNRLCGIVWRCSYCTETPTRITMVNLSVSVSLSVSV